jgi:hypothetical protein
MWAALIAAIPAVLDVVQKMVASGSEHSAIESAVSDIARAQGLIPSDASVKISPQEVADAASTDASAARKSALQGLTKMGQAGGMDDISRQGQIQAINAAQDNQTSANSSIESRLRQQGSYSPATAALMMQGASADANSNLSQASLQGAAEARKRALEAMTQSGSLANTTDAAELARQSFNAKMRDAANQYNSGAAMDLARMRYGGQKDVAAAKLGQVSANQAIDDRTTAAMYGVGAQASSAAKSYSDEQKAAAADAKEEARYQQARQDALDARKKKDW